VITYTGLAQLVAVAAGELSRSLPPGHVAIRVLGRILSELRTVARAERSGGADEMYSRAWGLMDRPLWLHTCGIPVSVAPENDAPPRYCDTCQQMGFWVRLYVKLSERP
jgi:hypothetical protein